MRTSSVTVMVIFFSKVSFWKYKVLPQRLRGILTTIFERHLPVEDFTDMDQHRCRICSSKSIAPQRLTYYCMLLLLSHKPRDDTHVTSMKVVQFSGPTTPCPSTSKIIPPLDLDLPISNETLLPLQMITNQLKENKIQRWLSGLIRSFLPSRFLDVSKTSCQQDVLQKCLPNIFKMSWRPFEDVLKISWRHFAKTS